MRDRKYRILIINPSAFSTKIAVFENDISIFEKTITHDAKELAAFGAVNHQAEFRIQAILETLHNEGMNLSKLDAVCGRGGLIRPIEGGTYLVNESMLLDLRNAFSGEHASNLGGILAHEIASGLNIPAYIVDPVVVDELDDLARFSGISFIERKSIFHALNQKAVSHRVAKEFGRRYEEMKFIVAHLGGGVTIGAHKNGRVIDVNNGLHGDGPFSQDRAGGVPIGDLVDLCFSGEYNHEEMMKMLIGKSGLVSYLGTTDLFEVEKMMNKGNDQARLVFEAMAYQIAKEIGAASAVLAGKVDSIVLTGRLAHSKSFVRIISDRVNWIADVIVIPGENDLLALAEGALRVLRGEEAVKQYCD